CPSGVRERERNDEEVGEVAKKALAKRDAVKTPTRPEQPRLPSGGNPQIAKGYGDAPVRAYIVAMPGGFSGPFVGIAFPSGSSAGVGRRQLEVVAPRRV